MLKRPPLILLSCALLLLGCGRQQPETNLATVTIVDRNGLTETVSSSDRLAGYDKVDFLTNHPYSEVVRVYKRDALGNVHSVATTYHENGQPHQMLEITNGRACGRYLQWFENGQLALSGTVLEGNAELTDAAAQSWKFDGECLSWNKEGNLVARIGYSKGYLDGKSTYFHCNGTIWKEVCFVAGLPEGEAVTRYPNGELLESAFFSQGMRHGTLTRYWECGKTAAREEYCLGKLQSGEYFHPNQATACSVVQGFGWKAICAKDFIVELRQVQDGQQEGEVKVFTPGGGLIQVYHVKNGLKNGEDIEYYAEAPGRIPKIKVLWVDGTIQGTVATWYPNGSQESKREVHNNQKQGMLTAWYRDGSLMLIEEYDSDKLVRGEYYKKGVPTPASRITEGEGTATLFDPEGNLSAKVAYKNGIPVL